ncbi:hypothetical protein FBQ84_02010 [Ignavibacteria bacterium CHB1]|nr:MAG: hypothetical protein EDM69_02470 [Chlorobiota bacterium]MBW7855930.1 hypothetical protein [Ignavibacteria bacterium]MCC6886436.1 hypothetical protein [Ignavibacteriales bacterium]MCE7952488.1 hypothetical protein [Chlorobi bacterium CHB7]MDL1886604.1 hypothetical protein [Ignavibacteria bacterium CHB1]OQY77295.1 MAG: hypothetical protein B6D43_06710 [Ignavibacteriales bacterium UTCHB1]RIK49071.1 MAG: hypothetical protein DCC60_05600 [Ignavibacteriota bacterium]
MLSFFYSCDNIFSPRIDNSSSSSIITDQKTIEGVFQNFKYAYTFKDTLVYGNLLADDFIFIYRDYVKGYDVSWDRQTDMKTTNGLFQNSQRLDIIWNNIVYQQGDSLNVSVKRSFNLSITFNPSDIVLLNGFVDMTLSRPTVDDKWMINKWRDESF